MNLKDYFASQPYGSKASLAKKIGVSKTWMSLIVSGRQKCSPELAVKIFMATEGKVTREDLRPDIFGGGQ
jgi:DNA-binding transcriptional regulator YdaS (Cro superfamily)